MCGRGLGHPYLVPGQISGLTGWTLGQPLPQSCCQERQQKMKVPHPCEWPLPPALRSFVEETVTMWSDWRDFGVSLLTPPHRAGILPLDI